MKKFLLFIIVVAVALFFTNPTEEEFKVYSEEYIATRVKGGKNESSKIKNILGDLAAEVGGKLTKELTSKEDYYLFSIYEVKLDKQEPYKFLGIGKNFLPLQSEEPFK
ncbi:MAG: DUF4359 domain-containing protein [Flavobacteriales bacterium]|jgi:Skp family chaperone for outer membrane proteins|nr:DUF4359 domain-containing protein [Flavobacteriales bacterium]